MYIAGVTPTRLALLPAKNIVHAVNLPTKLTVKGVLKYSQKKGD
jgi:hypothetical protein